MNKKLKPFLPLSLMILSVTTLSGCGKSKGGEIVDDEKTINLRLYKRGFGDEFIYELQEKFESVYAAEGYKVNILTPSPDAGGSAMVQEMSRGWEKTKIDLYITGDVTANMVGTDGEYGIVCEDIEESVYNQPSIAYDGKEGETVKQLINPDLEQFLRADDGTMYGFAWAQASAGLVVNTQKLARYGYTTLPRTTKEFLAMCEKIYTNYNGKDKTTLPLTYTIGNSGYCDCAFNQWYAQLGIDTFNEYCRFQTKENGSWKNLDSIEKFFDENLKETIIESYRFMDCNFAASGSTTQELDNAQQKLVDNGYKNDAVFMFNGDWFLNEIRYNFPDSINQFEFINVPVISKVGSDIFCKAPYNKTVDEADSLLSYVCGLVDNNKDVAEIKADVLTNKSIDMADSDIQKICDARGLSYARGPEHLAYITKGSQKKNIASLFLRMMASNDYAQTFMNTSNCSTPYAKDVKIADNNKFITQARDICLNKHYRAVRALIRGYRLSLTTMNTFFTGFTYLSEKIANDTNQYSKYDGKGGFKQGVTDQIYVDAGTNLLNVVKKNATEAFDEARK